MRYRKKGNTFYGQYGSRRQPTFSEIREAHRKRSKWAQHMDERLQAKVVKPEEYYLWMRRPQGYDVKGVDTLRLKAWKMEPAFYQKFHQFKLPTKIASEAVEKLKAIKPQDERLKDYFEMKVYVDEGQRITQISVEPRRPPMSVSLGVSYEEWMDTSNYLDNQARLMGKKAFQIMKEYDAMVKDYEKGRWIPVSEYEAAKAAT